MNAPDHRSPIPNPRSPIVLAFFVALSLWWCWPLPTVLASRIAFDPGDPLLNTWILWWNAQAVPYSDAWWNPPIFFPMRGALALSEHLAGVGVFTSPILLAGGSPALAYNVALLASCALSGFFTFLLTQRLTGSNAAALVAGISYALAPFRAGQLSHLQVLTSQWLPVVLIGLHGYVDTGRRRWLAVFAAGWILQSLSNGYYMLFAPVLIAMWIAWFVLAERRWREAIHIGAAWGVASLVLVPVVLKYREVHAALGLLRSGSEILRFSGSAWSFLKPAPMLSVWPRSPWSAVEDFLFPGLTIVLVIVITGPAALGIWKGAPARPALRSAFLFYVIAALAMAALTLGPARPDDGLAGWLKPYQWLMFIPGLNGVRVPVRFAMLMALCLAVAGGIGLAALPLTQPRWRALIAAVVAIGLTMDGAIKPLGSSAPPGRVDLPAAPAAAVLELPPDSVPVSVGAMFRSMSHRLPLINGYSGHIPRHYRILTNSLRRGDASAIVELARGRTLLLIVADRHDQSGYFRRLVESIPGVERREVTVAGASYLLPAQPSPRRPRGGTVHPFTASELPRNHTVLDLGAPRVVRTLEFPLRDRYPSLGRRIAIEASDDGVAWRSVFEDWTAGVAVAGALEDQRLVPVRLVLPDITARYLRIHPVQDWLVGELRVLGP